MRIFLLFVFTMGGFFCPVQAQKSIVLTSANTQLIAGIAHYNSATLSKFTAPKADTNHAWNYSNLVFSSNADINYLSNPFINFTSTNVAVATTGEFEQLTSDCMIPSNYVYDEDTVSIYQAGTFIPGQNFSLYNYFTNQNDSLYVPKQADYCRTNIITFPTIAKSVHKRNSVRKLNFTITVTSEGYKKAQGTKYTYFAVKDTVMGWGSLRLPSSDKASISYNVLLLKRKTITIDSIYINKKVPNPIYLTALGINQGFKTTTYEQFFYRAGYANPMMAISYGTDSTYTTPVNILYTTDSIKSGLTLTENNFEDLNIYPNPTNGIINCRFTKSSPYPWKLLVINSLGQQINTKTISGEGDLEIQSENNLNENGIYFINVIDENGQKIISKKIVVLR